MPKIIIKPIQSDKYRTKEQFDKSWDQTFKKTRSKKMKCQTNPKKSS